MSDREPTVVMRCVMDELQASPVALTASTLKGLFPGYNQRLLTSAINHLIAAGCVRERRAGRGRTPVLEFVHHLGEDSPAIDERPLLDLDAAASALRMALAAEAEAEAAQEFARTATHAAESRLKTARRQRIIAQADLVRSAAQS